MVNRTAGKPKAASRKVSMGPLAAPYFSPPGADRSGPSDSLLLEVPKELAHALDGTSVALDLQPGVGGTGHRGVADEAQPAGHGPDHGDVGRALRLTGGHRPRLSVALDGVHAVVHEADVPPGRLAIGRLPVENQTQSEQQVLGVDRLT